MGSENMQKEYEMLVKKFREYTETDERFIFNKDLESIQISNAKFIIVGDNPGKNERIEKRYLIGAAGKMGRSFFEKNFNIDYATEVITINKSTISTDKTEGLKEHYGTEFQEVFIKDQIFMANLLLELQTLKNIPVFIMGFSNYYKSGKWKYNDDKSGRHLAYYFNELNKIYAEKPDLQKNIYFIKHFSMGRFHEQFKNSTIVHEDPLEKLKIIGYENKKGFWS